MISRRTVLSLGVSQLVCWGTSYYLVGVLGAAMAHDLGWSRSMVHGGFSAALVAMGLVSTRVGRAIDRRGGRPVMVAGSSIQALGCLGIALSRGPVSYYASWIVLGVAMRMTLYDAAFASLARLGGASARRPISHVTLLGGLASTVFWPIGHVLAAALGWRGAVLAYGLFALSTIPLHLAIPSAASGSRPATDEPMAEAATWPPPERRASAEMLYALIVTSTAFLNSGMSAHMIDILTGLGVAVPIAVSIATFRGIGQSGARLGETLFGARLSPLTLCLGASAVLPLSFVIGLLSGQSVIAAFAFALLYGSGIGLHTIVRGTLPLVLFDSSAYGALVGRLLVPSFFLSALAPLALAVVAERFGPDGALHVSAAVAMLVLAAAFILRRTVRRR